MNMSTRRSDFHAAVTRAGRDRFAGPAASACADALKRETDNSVSPSTSIMPKRTSSGRRTRGVLGRTVHGLVG